MFYPCRMTGIYIRMTQNKYPPICLIDEMEGEGWSPSSMDFQFFHYPMKCVSFWIWCWCCMISQQIPPSIRSTAIPTPPSLITHSSVHHCRLNAWSRFDRAMRTPSDSTISMTHLHFVLASSFVPYRQIVKTEIEPMNTIPSDVSKTLRINVF